MKKQGYSAQAMVEFALTLMILLTIIIGLLEVGRLIFIYSSTVSASREAVRYGSSGGVNNLGNPYYQDCAGIRNAARKTAFLLSFTDADIVIKYDTGPGTLQTTYCTGTLDTSVTLNQNDRILVTVTSSYSPVVSILPLRGRTFEASTARTILGVVEVK